MVIEDQSRIFDHTEDTKDYTLNVKWQPTDNFKSTLDLNYVTAWVHNYDVTTGLDTIADVTLSTGSQGAVRGRHRSRRMPIPTMRPGSTASNRDLTIEA